MIGRRAMLAIAVIAASLIAAASSGAAIDASLVLRSADVPGLHAAGSGASVARAALGVRPPRALRGATVRGAAFRAGSRRLQVGTFALPSTARSRAAFATLARGGRRAAGIGDGATQRTRITRRATTSVVLLRVGRAVGAVRIASTGRDATAALTARRYAAALALRLRRVLAITAWERALGGIRADGTYSPQTALQAFAVAYGPIPGARRPAGPAGVPASATLAMQMVAREWERLTPAQHRAIDRRLGAPHDASSPRVARASAETLTPVPAFQKLVDKYNGIYHAKIPGVPPVTIKAYKTDTEITDAKGNKASADALPLNAAGEWNVGTPAYCRVRVPPEGLKSVGKPIFELFMAHEAFHCIQFVLMADWRERSAWLIEGMADWAAVTADPVPASVGANPYKGYLSQPAVTLFSRVYDATGFWGHIDETFGAGSLWAKIPAILATADDPAAFVTSGGTDPTFVGTWASAMWRIPTAGTPWYQTHPFAIPSSSLGQPVFDVTSNSAIDSAAYATEQYAVNPVAKQPLVRISRGTGSVRVGSESKDYGLVATRWFCLGGTCKCPKGKESSIPANTKVAGSLITVGITGGADKAGGAVDYHSLDEFCTKPEEPHGPAETNGDPHLTSLDGLHFDFQAAGEFVLARSRSGDLEIQARQEPYGTSRTVTVDTQLAMRVAGHRVTVGPGPKADDPPVVRVDGAVDPLAPGAVRSLGAASVSRDSDEGQVGVMWPDGSTVIVRPVGRWGVAARVELVDSRAGTMSGLLGDFDGNPADDLTPRTGARVAFTPVASSGWNGLTRYRAGQEFTGPFFDALYNRFGDSWRIKQAASLFDYGPGESTRTFDDRSIPTKPVDPDELTRARRAAAEKVCRAHGVTQPGPLADCITDVAATGNAAFADDALAAQDAALVSWTRLRTGADRHAPLSLLATRDGFLHLGIQELSGSAHRMIDVNLDRADHESAPEPIDGVDGDLTLMAEPDGGVRGVASEIPASLPSGVYQYGRNAAGAWSGLGPVTTQGASYAGLPVSVFAADGTLLTISPMAGNARVFRGTGNPNPGIDPNPELPDCYSTSAAIARDGVTGELWAAWVQWDCPQQGVFARRIDPATGGPIGPEIKAPGSTWTTSTGERYPSTSLGEALPLTGRPGQAGVYLAFASDDGAKVRLWRVGAATSTAVPRRKFPASDVRLTADPVTGRLWLAWAEGDRLWVQPIGVTGVPSGVRRLADPPRGARAGSLSLHHWDIAARGDGLDVLYGFARDGDTPGGLWHARMTP